MTTVSVDKAVPSLIWQQLCRPKFNTKINSSVIIVQHVMDAQTQKFAHKQPKISTSAAFCISAQSLCLWSWWIIDLVSMRCIPCWHRLITSTTEHLWAWFSKMVDIRIDLQMLMPIWLKSKSAESRVDPPLINHNSGECKDHTCGWLKLSGNNNVNDDIYCSFWFLNVCS